AATAAASRRPRRGPAPATARPRPTSRRRPTSRPRSSRPVLLDVLRDHMRVLAYTVQNRRLALALEVHTHEVQARDRASARILDGEAHVAEDREQHPVVAGTKAGGPDHSLDTFSGEVHLGARANLRQR